MADITVQTFIDTFMAAANEAAARTALGLGTIATQAANGVSITGGVITGLTQFALAAGTNPAAGSAFDLGTITNTTSVPLEVAQTWNNSGLAGTAVRIAVTNTASDAASNLLEISSGAAGTTKRLRVRASDGRMTLGNQGSSGYLVDNAGGGGIIFGRSDDGDVGNIGFYGVRGIHMRRSAFFGWGADTGNYQGQSPDCGIGCEAAGTYVFGFTHATTPTAQLIKGHNVTTGTGASMTLAGGPGSVAGGAVILATSATTGAPAAVVTVKASGIVNIANLPTSASGLVTGDLWNNSGALAVA